MTLKNSIIVAIGLAIGSAIGIFLSTLQVSADKTGEVDNIGAKSIIVMTQIVEADKIK